MLSPGSPLPLWVRTYYSPTQADSATSLIIGNPNLGPGPGLCSVVSGLLTFQFPRSGRGDKLGVSCAVPVYPSPLGFEPHNPGTAMRRRSCARPPGRSHGDVARPDLRPALGVR